MARVNITVPDELLARARAAGLNVSRLASAALVDELDRLERIAELDRYLSALEADHGPVSVADATEAKAWVDELQGKAAASPAVRAGAA